MSILGSNMLAGAAGRARHQIERSLRFNSGDSAHLTRTPSSASNSTTFTWSAWVKTVRSDSHETLFSATPSGDGTLQYDFILENDRLYVYGIETFFVYEKKLSRVFRDRSAWYHLVVAFDTTDSTAEDRIKIYVNGERQTDFATNSNPSASRTTGFNKTNEHSIGARTGYSGAQYFDGYQAEINFIDGSQLGPESFGETDLETGAWIPRQYNGSYGTNGFYLKFADNSGVTATTLGKDSSGNGNNWTPNNFSVTAGAGNDSLLDTPTNNWCTLNPVNKSYNQPTFSNGNLNVAPNAGNYQNAFGSIPVFSGKWYGECKLNGGPNSANMIGVSSLKEVDFLSQGNDYIGDSTDGFGVQLSTGDKYNDAGSSFTSAFADGDVFGIALDLDNGKVWFSKNGTYPNNGNPATGFGAAFTGLTSSDGFLMGSTVYSGGVSSFDWNFGQRAFAYTPPAGFEALSAKNLPTPIVLNGKKYFNTVLFTGNGSTQSITGVGFQPDWTWIKMRSDGSRGHALFDSVRGGTERLDSSATQEGRTNEGNISFQADGFNVTSSHPTTNDSSDTAVAWNWKAGGAVSENHDGSISSDVSANPEAGFSIVSFVAPSGSNQETVGHGLNVKPKVIIAKNRDSNANNWAVFHEDVTDTTSKFLRLNTTDTIVTYSTVWGSAMPTSTVFGVTGGGIAASGTANIAYCFSEVEGYSKFGTYTGNGSTDGTYVTTNFQPAFVLVKRIDSTDSWQIHDVSRAPYNPSDKYLLPDSDGAEGTITTIDFLSNGFKLRNSSNLNNSGGSFLYMAFAETPFKYANAR